MLSIEFTGGYMVTRYADAFRLLRDRSIGSTADNATSTPTIDAERAAIDAERAAIARDPAGPSMLRGDGDDHTRLRRLVTQAFTLRAIE